MPKPRKIISWNVNGLRAVIKKGLLSFIEEQQPDVLCLQEIKIKEEQAPKLEIPFPCQYYHSAEKPGYSGTATFAQEEVLSVRRDLSATEGHPPEGRVLVTEHDAFFLVNVYVPNSQDELRRLDYRTQAFDPAFRDYLRELDAVKPVVACGDFNVAHEEIDIARPKANRRSAGFTDEERAEFTHHLEAGFADAFRRLYPDARDCYTWWSYRGGARARNVGWRIDYFLVSERLMPQVREVEILHEVMGSDHCPLSLTLDVH